MGPAVVDLTRSYSSGSTGFEVDPLPGEDPQPIVMYRCPDITI